MNRIHDLRLESKKSMRQVAEKLKIPYTTYVNYEKGLREPNSEMLIKIANFYGVTVDYLVGNVNDPFLYVDNARSSAEINEPPENKKTPTLSKEDKRAAEIMFALSRGGEKEITDEMFEEVKRFATFLAEQKHKGE